MSPAKRFITNNPANRLIPFLLLILLAFPAKTDWPQVGYTQNQLAPDSPKEQASSYDVEIPILAYHNFDSTAPTQYYVTAEQFASQMDVLLAYGYQTVSLDDFHEYYLGAAIPPEKPIIITIDDGFLGAYQHAAPILQARGMQATFFIPTAMIADTEAARQDNSWQSGAPLAYHMIWPEILALYANGFQIESHSVNHPDLTTIGDQAAQTEILQSRLDIQAQIPGNTVNYFAYPFGEDNETIHGFVQDAGYQAAVDYDPDDGIANPAISDLWELPRRDIHRDVSLDLDTEDPWWFFMRRVDPDFPIPNIALSDFLALDDSGIERYQYYQGEPITITVTASNWASPVNVIGRLSLNQGESILYDSHNQAPIADVSQNPLPHGNSTGIFGYEWVIPPAAPTGAYSYTFEVSDQHYMLGYYGSTPQAAISVEESPISVEVNSNNLLLSTRGEVELIFTTNYSGTDAGQMYLSVSFSEGITVTQASPADQWVEYPVGSWVKAKGCSSACIQTSYLLYELFEDLYGGGIKTYRLTLKAAPGESGPLWLNYRLSMRVVDQFTSDWFLRAPLSGEVDQQLYYAYPLPGLALGHEIFLPITSR